MKEAAVEQGVERVSFATSREQLDMVQKLAVKHQRTLSGEVRMALDYWIDHCDTGNSKP